MDKVWARCGLDVGKTWEKAWVGRGGQGRGTVTDSLPLYLSLLLSLSPLLLLVPVGTEALW